MTEEIVYRPIIKPIPEGRSRPLWSVMIPTYNCAKYLKKTLNSVLAQDLGPEVMQIMVVDDCSTQDNPEEVVEEIGKGRVEFYRQPVNVGAVKNFQTSLKFARGKLIHQLHGDDYVLDGFYQQLQLAFETHPEIGAAFCRSIFIDEEDHWRFFSPLERAESGVLPPKWLERIATLCCLQTPSIVVRREVYEKLGGFDLRLSAIEDWEMWVRIATHYPIWHEITPLAAYRMHSKSLSRNLDTHASGLMPREYYKAIQLMHSYLPESIRYQVLQRNKRSCALLALSTAQFLVNHNYWHHSIKLIQFSLTVQLSYPVIRWISRILLIDGTKLLLQKVSHLISILRRRQASYEVR